jgi:hypothetical protein
MHTPKLLKSPIARKLPSSSVRGFLAFLAAALFGALMLFAIQAPAAQPPAAQPPPSQPHKADRLHTGSGRVLKKTLPAQAAPTPVTPPVPILPHWPANDKPAEAAVTWDSQGLRIEAANSSLRQIMKDVSAATGAKVEGMGADERVFGVYGPGQARDVLSQLLQGCGYNVMMVGDLGQGAPRQIVLSSRHSGDTPKPASNSVESNNDDEDTDADEQPQPQPQPLVPVPNRPAILPVGSPHAPQQIMQEMQQRPQQLNSPQK